MKGYPKHLNTKHDYDYVQTHFPKENANNPDEAWGKDFQALLDDQKKYFEVKTLKEGEVVALQKDQKIITETDTNGKEIKRLVELRVDSSCKMARLGVNY
jgi:hypothetical protein